MIKSSVEFKSAWWTAQLPAEWKATESDDCVTFSGKQFPSALQISAARKDGGVVTNTDLREFAVERAGKDMAFREIKLPAFDGIYAEHVERHMFWREWWLRFGNLMVYVTYNVAEEFHKSETSVVDNIVRNLKPLEM